MHHERHGQGLGVIAIDRDILCHLAQEGRTPVGGDKGQIAGGDDMRAAAAFDLGNQIAVVRTDIGRHPCAPGIIGRVVDRIAHRPDRKRQRVAQMTSIATGKGQANKRGKKDT